MSITDRGQDIRIVTAFILGLSIGIVVMYMYEQWRAPHHEVTIEYHPADQVETSP